AADDGHGEVTAHFTPPAVRPSTRFRWNTRYSRATGAAQSSDAAINWPYTGIAPPSWVAPNTSSATAAVRLSTLVITEANSTSFHPSRNAKIAATSSPGQLSGSTIRVRIRHEDAP